MADEEFAELGDIQLSQFDRNNNRWITTTNWGRSPGSSAVFNSQQHHQHQQQQQQQQLRQSKQQQIQSHPRSFQYRRPVTAATTAHSATFGVGGVGASSSSSNSFAAANSNVIGNVRYWNNRAAEAEDVMGHYNYKTNKQQTMYYSPPGTSYTIVEKNSSVDQPSSSHKRFLPKTPNSANNIYFKQQYHRQLPSSQIRQQKTNSLIASAAGKRSISPEQIIKFLSANNAGRQHKSSNKSPPMDFSSAAQLSNRKLPRNQSLVNFDEELPIRTVTMARDVTPGGAQGFGICVKGGSKEPNNVGVYISRVEEGSIAEKAGLRPGDTILEVNGIPFANISHDEALKILKSRHQINMMIKPTLLSQKLNHHHGVGNSWILRHSYTWIDRLGRSVSPPPDYMKGNPPNQWPSSKLSKEKVKKIELTIEPSQTLGLVIRGGIEYGLGIFVTGVDKDSVADKSGLQIGDQILDVNGTSFLDITHDEAVSFLKKQTRMTITIRDVGKIPHSCSTYDSDPSSRDNHRRTIRKIPRSETIQMIEEKASSVLEKSDFATLSYYIEEYCSKNMTFDTFITVLLDLFDTTEKYTLMTELREIITTEDKPKFDEVVYQRHAAESSKNYHNPRLKPTENNYGRNSNVKCIPSHQTRSKANKCVIEDNYTVCTQDNDGLRSPSEDSGLGLGPPELGNGRHISSARIYRNDMRYSEQKQFSNNSKFTSQASIEEDLGYYHQDYNDMDTESISVPRRRSSNPECIQISDKTNPSYEEANMCGYLEGLRSHLGGWTQKIKDWYWGGNSVLAHKLGQGCDINDNDDNDPQSSANRQQQRKGDSDNGCEKNAHITTDSQGNLRITVKKTKPLLGIAIEGGVNTRHPLPRIINIHEHGAAFEAGGLEVGQLILEVDRRKVEGMQHQEVARLIAENYANTDCPTIEFLVVEAKKSNMEPKPTALIFLDN